MPQLAGWLDGWWVGWLAETKENFLINYIQPGRGRANPTLFQTCEAGSRLCDEGKILCLCEKDDIWVRFNIFGPSYASIADLLHLDIRLIFATVWLIQLFFPVEVVCGIKFHIPDSFSSEFGRRFCVQEKREKILFAHCSGCSFFHLTTRPHHAWVQSGLFLRPSSQHVHHEGNFLACLFQLLSD